MSFLCKQRHLTIDQDIANRDITNIPASKIYWSFDIGHKLVCVKELESVIFLLRITYMNERVTCVVIFNIVPVQSVAFRHKLRLPT